MMVQNENTRSPRTALLLAMLTLTTLLSVVSTPVGAHSQGVQKGIMTTFTDVSDASGISIVDTGPTTNWASYGPGVSVDDCDQDGDMDAIFTARFDHLSYENGAFESGKTQFMMNNGDGTFTDWTAESGLKLEDSTVIGASWADYDNDGDKDLYLSAFGESNVDDLDSGSRNTLFNNDGNCRFTDVTADTGAGQGARGRAIVVNGVITEVVILNSGSGYATSGGLAPAIYFRGGNGSGAIANAVVIKDADDYSRYNGRVVSVSMIRGGEGYDDANPPEVKFVSGVANYGHSTTAIWSDYDHDGDVDLYSMNLGIVDEELYWARTETNFLYRNDGDVDGDGEMEFSDVTTLAGVSGQAETSESPNKFFLSGLYRMDQASPSNPSTMAQLSTADYRGTGLSFAGVWFDYDEDGWEDLYVASDFGMSPIYRNNHDGTFTVVTKELDMDLPGTGMGTHAGDWDGDGDLDLCHSNFGPNYLWENENGESFSERSSDLGFRDEGSAGSFVAVNWACQLFDYDLDGDLDIFFGVGRINRFTAYNNNTLYRNEGDTDGDGVLDFVDISNEIGLRTGTNGNKTMGVSIFDYDGDGDLDILLGHSDRSPQLFSNNAVEETGRHWLKIQLKGRENDVNAFQRIWEKEYSNSYGTGCLVTVTLEDGHELSQHVYAGSGYLGSNEPTVHFGLDDDNSVESVEVKWTTGITQVVRNVEADQTLVLEEPTSLFFIVFEVGFHQYINWALYVILTIIVLAGAGFAIVRKMSPAEEKEKETNDSEEE
jgi:hypothetical protein